MVPARIAYGGAMFRRLGLLLLVCLPLRADDAYKTARKAFEDGMKRPPLGKRAGTITRFAATRDPRALKLLMARYDKPKFPKAHEQYLIAEALGRSFRDPVSDAAQWAVLKRHKRDEHAWLWYQLLRGPARRPDPSAVHDVVLDSKMRPYLRAAALETMVGRRRSSLAMVPRLLAPEAKLKGASRILLPETAASILLANRRDIKSAEFQAAAQALLAQLAEQADTLPRTRPTRALYWRQLLGYQEVKHIKGPTVAARPRFFGLEATGDRIAYLIDLSDSMLEPLTKIELADARRLTGTDEIDWSKVLTRFDLARMFLARSLHALDPKVRFTVIGFGDKAAPLKATRGLVRATRGSVKSAIRELQGMRAFGKDKLHPHGQLRGKTNIHSAFVHAFRATKGKRGLGALEFISTAGLIDGCDTIFLLSDGEPTTDNFAANDRFSGGRVTVNAETGETKASGAGSASYRGPYARRRYLVEDVRRMNLFRKAEIHCIGMAGADPRLLRDLAEIGLGRYRAVGVRAKGGRVNRWWLMRPLKLADDPAKWSEPLGPEKAKFDRWAEFQGVGWYAVTGSGKQSVVNVGRGNRGAAYAYAEFEPDAAGKAQLHAGAREVLRVWLNGELVLDKLTPAKWKFDAYKVKVELKAGRNTLLVKVCNRKGDGRFHLRLTDLAGKPLSYRQ